MQSYTLVALEYFKNILRLRKSKNIETQRIILYSYKKEWTLQITTWFTACTIKVW